MNIYCIRKSSYESKCLIFQSACVQLCVVEMENQKYQSSKTPIEFIGFTL